MKFVQDHVINAGTLSKQLVLLGDRKIVLRSVTSVRGELLQPTTRGADLFYPRHKPTRAFCVCRNET